VTATESRRVRGWPTNFKRRDDLGPLPGHRLDRDWLAVRALSAAQRQKTISFSPHVHVHLFRPSKISLPARSRTELAPCTLLAPVKAPRKTHPHKPFGPSSLCTLTGTHPYETLGVISSCAQPFSRHPSFQFHIDFVLIVLLIQAGQVQQHLTRQLRIPPKKKLSFAWNKVPRNWRKAT
jgi:hypothetical protein